MSVIVGRANETRILQSLLSSKAPEFLALYGRRRVGKTFLIKNFFKKKKLIFFSITGEKDAPMSQQIKHFTQQIGDVFFGGIQLAEGKNWDETFKILTNAFETVSKKDKIVLFFDEFPWMATQNSRLLQNLDYFWNQYWSNDSRIKLIICGSAASWIIDNIVNNTGGLHNRITKHICLEPLNLPETKSFLREKGILLSNKQIVDLYMSMGGVPHYLNQIEKGLSATQVIESLAFKRKGFLLQEFDNLFSSLFKNSEVYENIVKVIASSLYQTINQSESASSLLSAFETYRQVVGKRQLGLRLSALEFVTSDHNKLEAQTKIASWVIIINFIPIAFRKTFY